jgi:hypothetical protein
VNYLLLEALVSLIAGVLFILASIRIWTAARDKSWETRRATVAYSFLWGTAAAGSLTLVAANLAAIMEWKTLDNVFSAASGLIWGLAVIPFFYICAYLILQTLRAARIAAVCGGALFVLGAWLAYQAPRVVKEVSPHYFMHIFEGPLVQVYVVCAVVLPGIVASVFLYRTALQLEGTGRWRGLMGTAAMDVYILSMLTRVVWQELAANVISRILLLASALLIFWTYFSRRPAESGKEPDGAPGA